MHWNCVIWPAYWHLITRGGSTTRYLPPIPTNYDGYAWRYIGVADSGTHHWIGVGGQYSQNLGSRGSYAHCVYHFTGMAYRPMMYDSYINICEDILTTGATDDRDNAARAIEEGYILRREDGTFFVPTPALTLAQKRTLDVIAESCLAPLMPEYTACVNCFAAGYKQLFPAHLADDAARMCQNFFMGMYDCIGPGTPSAPGRWEKPPRGATCDVLIQHKAQ